MDVDFKKRENLIPSSLLAHNQDFNNHDSGNSDSVFSGFGSSGSSSSYLNTPGGSELDSTETESDDDDFIAQLTRQMADYMLQEDDESAGATSFDSEKSKFNQLEKQPRVRNNGSINWGRRGTITESTQQLQHWKQQDHMQKRGRAKEFGNGGKLYPIGSSPVGSGMTAVFLGGSASRNASCGTGVFLPRAANKIPDQSRKKRGCSTVLIPTRVLQALEQHFNNMESLSPSNGYTTHPSRQYGGRESTEEKSQVRAAIDHQETELPQEWIY